MPVSQYSIIISYEGKNYQTIPSVMKEVLQNTKNLLTKLKTEEIIPKSIADKKYQIIKQFILEVKTEKEKIERKHNKKLKQSRIKTANNQPIIKFKDLPQPMDIENIRRYRTFAFQQMNKGLEQPSIADWDRIKKKKFNWLQNQLDNPIYPKKSNKLNRKYNYPIGTSLLDITRFRAFAGNRVRTGNNMPTFQTWIDQKKSI